MASEMCVACVCQAIKIKVGINFKTSYVIIIMWIWHDIVNSISIDGIISRNF